MYRDMPPPFGRSNFSPGNAPPTPPHHDPLDDIYGSAPSSPTLGPRAPDEILSDLPSRQRAYEADAYREGLSAAKGRFVQEGFDEGYALGASVGQRVGYLLGVLQNLVRALKRHDEERWAEARRLWDAAQRELALQEVLGSRWVDEEGIWKWEVQGEEEEVTLREVAEQHPVVKEWMAKVQSTAERWSVDLEAVEKRQSDEDQRAAVASEQSMA